MTKAHLMGEASVLPASMFASPGGPAMMTRGPMIPRAPEDDAGGGGGGGEADDDFDPNAVDEGADENDLDAGDDQDPDEDNQDGDDEDEEVEFGGKTFKAPKGIKDALLMRADYTQKTQKLAERERAFETQQAEASNALAQRQTAMDEQAALFDTVLAERVEVASLQKQVDAFNGFKWHRARAEATTPEKQQALAELEDQYEELKENLSKAQGKLADAEKAHKDKAADNAKTAEAERSTRITTARATLISKIPSWPKDAAAVAQYAIKEFGVTAQELGSVDDPRILQAFHRAWEGDQLKAKQKTGDKLRAGEKVRSGPKVNGGGQPTGRVRDDSNTKTWMERRQAQVDKRRAAGR